MSKWLKGKSVRFNGNYYFKIIHFLGQTITLRIPCTKQEKLEHEWEVTNLGLGVCKRCGQLQTTPTWPPYCSRRKKK